MSERISYRARKTTKSSKKNLNKALEKKGLNLSKTVEWNLAQARIEQLQKNLKSQLESTAISTPDPKSISQAKSQALQVRGMLDAFTQVPEFKLYAEQKKPKALTALKSRIKSLTESPTLTAKEDELSNLAGKAKSDLESLATEVQHELCMVEKESTLGEISQSLDSLGYQVERQGDALKAMAGQTSIWAELDDRGLLSMDASGFSGMACTEKIKEIEDEFKKRGMEVEKVESHHHGKAEGGVLAQKLKPLFPEFKRIKNKKNNGQMNFQWEKTKQGA